MSQRNPAAAIRFTRPFMRIAAASWLIGSTSSCIFLNFSPYRWGHGPVGSYLICVPRQCSQRGRPYVRFRWKSLGKPAEGVERTCITLGKSLPSQWRFPFPGSGTRHWSMSVRSIFKSQSSSHRATAVLAAARRRAAAAIQTPTICQLSARDRGSSMVLLPSVPCGRTIVDAWVWQLGTGPGPRILLCTGRPQMPASGSNLLWILGRRLSTERSRRVPESGSVSAEDLGNCWMPYNPEV